jgi:PleD family two-component response regulator
MAPDSPLASYQLLQLVDDNLYQAKKLGRNQVVGSVN